jgi:hypothetical protein
MGEPQMGILLAFRLKPRLRPRDKTRLFQRLYGYVDRSQFGRYRYERGGLLSAIPHVRLIRAAFILREEDLQALKEFLGPLAEVHTRRVVLTQQDQRHLFVKTKRK